MLVTLSSAMTFGLHGSEKVLLMSLYEPATLSITRSNGCRVSSLTAFASAAQPFAMRLQLATLRGPRLCWAARIACQVVLCADVKSVGHSATRRPTST